MMAEQQDKLIIYTIGHSNTPINDFIDLLVQQEIDVVVDVRSAPYSKFTPQFNREILAHDLATCAIEYRFAGEILGGRPKDPTCYKNGQIPEGKANYLELVNYSEVAMRPWFQKGIDHLIAIAEQRRTAIMCSEEDPQRCHRHHLIAKALLEKEIHVQHICNRSQGILIDAEYYFEEKAKASQTPQQPSLF